MEVSEYRGRQYCHIRKFFHGKRTKYGVAFISSEVEALTKAFAKHNTFPKPKTTWSLGEDAKVQFGDKTVTFTKRTTDVYVSRQEFENLRKLFPKVHETVMTAEKNALLEPKTYCDNCRGEITPGNKKTEEEEEEVGDEEEEEEAGH